MKRLMELKAKKRSKKRKLRKKRNFKNLKFEFVIPNRNIPLKIPSKIPFYNSRCKCIENAIVPLRILNADDLIKLRKEKKKKKRRRRTVK